MAGSVLPVVPDFVVYNKTLNPWGRDRQMPQFAGQTFRQWYLKNRKKDDDNDEKH